MILKLPAQAQPPTFHKDGSVVLKFETRELLPEELMFILGCRQTEGRLVFASQEAEIDDSEVLSIKETLDLKSHSQRLKDVLFVWYKQATQSQLFVGDFDTFYKQKMETIIEGVKTKLHD